MNAKNFKVVTLSVLAPVWQEDCIENDMLQLAGGLGLYAFGTSTRTLTRAEWREVKSQVPSEVLEQE